MNRREFLSATAAAAYAGPARSIVFVAGPKSHGYGQHAHWTGCRFLARRLETAFPSVRTTVCRDGWPKDESVFEGAAAIVLFMDGADKHPVLPHLNTLEKLVRGGAGLIAMHYALVVPKGAAGDLFVHALGGYYETHWSVNPMWTARFDRLPAHPVTRGVEPFAIYDEWYFHMRFQEGMRGVTPILTAAPPDALREKPFGPHSGNPAVRARKGMPEHVAWVYERPEGGRGFGFTGCHYHWSFGHDGFRNILLNGIAWTARLEVPRAGVGPRTPDWEELLADQEGVRPEGFGPEQARELIRPKER
jgi:hypothetical protein